jgi:cyclic pyranopterin phosphate synthase
VGERQRAVLRRKESDGGEHPFFSLVYGKHAGIVTVSQPEARRKFPGPLGRVGQPACGFALCPLCAYLLLSMSDLRDQFGRPLRDLRISVTDRCNFRCPYCMPAEVFGPGYPFLNHAQSLSFTELSRLLRQFVRTGVAKVRITGGEPLLRSDVPELVRLLKQELQVPDVAITTNGWLLEQRATALRSAGLDRLNVSLDSLRPDTFARLSGGRGASVERVLAGIAAARALGLPVKINMVVQRGVNDGDILELAEWARLQGHPLRFIEFMDVGNHNGWSRERVVPAREILDRLAARWPLEPVLPAYRGEVAVRYRYRDGGGEIGLISSVTQPFCGDCHRARLSADGKLYTCLFATRGWDLLAALRAGASDAELEAFLERVWRGRLDRYSDERAELLARHETRQKIEMSYIGG